MITNPNVKINLGLNVLRKREDGFHDLETLFVPYFGISDTLEIIVGDDYSRTSSALYGKYGTPCPGEEEDAPMLVQAISEDGKLMITIARADGVDWDPLKDLTAKAYFMLAEDFDLPPVKIFLEKTSPVGAGLGGGSADAAFALKMLNELCSLALDEKTLAGYAARLGSDCAFFIYNRPMIGTGRGEILEPADIYPLDNYEIRMVYPPYFVSTAAAYGGIVPRNKRAENGEKFDSRQLVEMLRNPVETWKECVVNDFETTVFAKIPQLAPYKDELYAQGAVYASMSGSGSSFFGIFRK